MKGIKKALKTVGIGFAALVVLVIVISIFGGGSDLPQETLKQQTKEDTETKEGSRETDHVAMVRTGYLGEYTDVTVDGIIAANLGVEGFSVDWTESEMDGADLVGCHVYLDGDGPAEGTTILFKICSDKTFKVAGYAEGSNEDFEPTQIADFLNNWYMNWYVLNKVGTDALEDEADEKDAGAYP